MSAPGTTAGSAPATSPHRPELWWTVQNAAVVTGRNLRHFLRQPQLLVFSTIQPIMFVLLFVYVFSGAIEKSLPPGLDYVDYLIPGILIQATAFRSSQTAVGLAEDLARGVVDRFRSMPIARSAVLMGRTIADLVRTLLVTLLMIGVGYLVGFNFSTSFIDALGAILVVCLFGLAMSWIFAFVGLVVKGAETAQSAGFVAMFPLVFASSIFVPVSTMPDWLQAFADHSPVTYTVNATRALAIGGDVAEPLLYTALWLGGMLAVFVPLCVWRYRKMS
jgi:ABC-2 type transport system permease protein/oleandomycin transport system permease protein